MIRLDTFKISVPLDCVKDWDQSKYWTITKKHPNGDTFENSQMINKSIGLDTVSVNDSYAVIKGSAKILKDNYPKGICNNTLDQFFDEISKHSGISINTENIEDVKVLLCDVTNQVQLDDMKQWNDIKMNLHASCVNPDYIISNYQRKGNKGIVVTGKQATEKNRSISYPKHDEITMAKNKHFILSLSDPQKYLTLVRKAIRNELNITSKKALMKRLKVIDNNLQTVLNSSETPNYNFLKNIMNVESTQMTLLFKDFEGMSLDQIRNRIGMEGICERSGYNEGFLKAFIKEKEGKNWDKKWHGRGSIGYKDIISKHRQKDSKSPESLIILSDFMEKMRVA